MRVRDAAWILFFTSLTAVCFGAWHRSTWAGAFVFGVVWTWIVVEDWRRGPK